MATDLSQFTVPNDRFDVAQDNAAKLDSVVNGPNAVVTTRTGKGIQSIDKIIESIASVTDRGVWATATSYQVKDLVLDSGFYYIAINAHTSGATFAGDVANWRIYQGSVPQGDKRYGPIFATVAAMVTASPVSLDGVVVDLVVGMAVNIVDYATGNNSGLLTGTVVAASTGAADGGEFIDLANGLQFKQGFPTDVGAKMFGATGLGVADETAKIESAFNSGTDIVDLPEGDYSVTKSFFLFRFTGPGRLMLNGVTEIDKNFYEPFEEISRALAIPNSAGDAELTTAVIEDDTPPRNDEGDEVIQRWISPKRENSHVLAKFDTFVTTNTAGANVIASMFLNDEVSSRHATLATTGAANDYENLRISADLTPKEGETEKRVSIRVGSSSGFAVINGRESGGVAVRRLGGAAHTRLDLVEVAGDYLEWGGGQVGAEISSSPLVGPLATPVPGRLVLTVSQPNGAAVTEGDLASHRYRHHTSCYELNGRIWVAHSLSGTNEDAGGQRTVISSADATAGTPVFGSLLEVVPSQSTWTATGASFPSGGRLSYPRVFARDDVGKLYIVAAIDEVASSAVSNGLALVARECIDGGTLGPLFRVSPDTYTPLGGFSAIDHDPILGPQLIGDAELFGTWGGSNTGFTQKSWLGFLLQDGYKFSEPTTVDVRGDGKFYVRIWRVITGPTNVFSAIQHSTDGGDTWTPVRYSTIPNSPSATNSLRLASGKIAVSGNLQSGRDPLFLAYFDAETGLREETVRFIQQGMAILTLSAGETLVAGEILTQATSGATAVVIDDLDLTNAQVKAEQVTGTWDTVSAFAITGSVSGALAATCTGFSTDPVFPGTFKAGPAAAYSWLFEGATFMWACCSISKEDIRIVRFTKP
jgi:hypothetical protein